MKRFAAGILALTLVVLAGCSKPAETEKVDELIIGFVPSQEAGQIGDKVQPMSDFLSKELGVPVKTNVGTNFAAVVEGMGSKQIDIGFLNAFGYVLASNDYGVKSVLKSVRRGSPQYRAQLSVRADSGIPACDEKADAKCTATFEALKGKKLAFVDPASTSGYLFPSNYMKNEVKIDVEKWFSQTIMAGGHDVAAKAVYNGDVDAAWTFEGIQNQLKELPDAKEKLIPVAYTSWIPNDGVSVRKGLSDEMVKKITDAFLKYASTDEGKKVLKELYTIDGFAPGSDKDYDVVRSTAKAMGVDLKAELQKKK